MRRLSLVALATATMIYLLVSSIQPMAQPSVPLPIALAVLGIYAVLAVMGLVEIVALLRGTRSSKALLDPAVSSHACPTQTTSVD